jgi:hypothetical protein
MEATLTDCFAAVQDVYQFEDWQTAAALLTEILGLPPVTARQKARKSRGYLASNLSEELARRLRDACSERGLGVQVVPQSDVVPVIKPVRMHQVWIAEDALKLGAAGLDAKMLLGWDTLRLIAVTKTTKKESFQHWDTTNRRTPVVAPRVTTYTEEFAECLADVFAFSPHGQVLGARLLSRELNYAEALGDMIPDAAVDADARMDGFRLLLSAIASRASQLYIPPESLALLSSPARASALMPPAGSLDEFDGYNRWLLQRLRLRGSRPGGVGLH